MFFGSDIFLLATCQELMAEENGKNLLLTAVFFIVKSPALQDIISIT